MNPIKKRIRTEDTNPGPGAQSTISFHPPQILITYESLLKQIKVEYRLHSCLN